MSEERKMDHKRVLVTGSGTGIGRGVALEFSKAGATVALHYAHSEDGCRSAAVEIEKNGGKAKAFKADLGDIDECQDLASGVLEYLGGIDVLINNSGITMNKPFLEVTPEQFNVLYNVNIRGMFFLTQFMVPNMIEEGGGAVINLTSVHAYAGMTEHTVYAGTKGAIVSFTRVLALELAQKGIRVNAIAPGWILVENHLSVLKDFDRESAASGIPAGIIGEPTDIGKLALFLASEEARYIVGQTFVVDGGQLSIMPLTGDFREDRKEQWGQGYVPDL
ncbi:MAG: 3-oxoacyl-[acyl-carrier-protein] reductase FabG [Candidatus Moanabacter tarae]|uniref:3-oxoacyl-[acyl-carrier-protein] reductase FabG n=1 Tax=Candidatus Moanibacter tarae TaxID=2200854 RepID=A0A2Z4AGU5_9BACT|nr:MAG: 3-oxoacyl-[acyl-carrier-protein] reductase FabG [Candidatus Moanabacter tarae]|tara:strand:- start:4040 stop:4870 length:831 start_codon:yes stop_codon:yes gene_type:complete